MRLIFLSTWAVTLMRLTRKLWLRVSLFALLAIIVAGVSILMEGQIPGGVKDRFTIGAMVPVLSIVASSMLSVSTFSLAVMVSAHSAAAGQTTPRVHRILLEDTTTHTALAVFIGAFVYALTGIILIKSNIYPEGTGVLVMGFTVAVVVLVVLALLRWIHHLSDLGSMDATLAKAEAAARGCLDRARRRPSLGGAPLTRDMILPETATPITAQATGYVQFIDMPGIDERLSTDQTRVYLYARPGDYLIEGQIIGHATGLDSATIDKIARRLTIGPHRTFEQDASYGLLVLSETASRALSPGINDPGTAIDVICRQEKLLLDWARATPAGDTALFPRICLPDTSRHAMIENAFAGAARDGAGQIEVALRLRDALGRIADSPDPDLAQAAQEMSARALEYAEAALPLEGERTRLRDATVGISFLP